MKRFLMIAMLFCISATLLIAGGSEEKKPAAAGQKTLTVWTWKLAYIPGFEAAAAAFEKKSGVKVVFEPYTPDQTYRQKASAAAATNTLPDVVHWWGTVGVEFADQLVDMRDVLDASWKNQFYPVAWPPVTVSQSQYDDWQKGADTSPVYKNLKVGHIMGIPLDVGAFFMFYGNKKLLEKAGIPLTPPKTWEDFIAMMKTAKAKTGVPALTFGGKFLDLWANWCGNALMTMANGADGYGKLLKRETKLSDPENLRIIKAAYEVVKNDLLMPGLLNLTIDEADQAFYAGKAIFNLGGSFTLSTLIAMGMDPNDLVVFPVPPIAGSKLSPWKINPFTLTMMSVKKGPNQKEAIDFVKFLCSPEGSLLFAKNAYDIPAIDLGKAGVGDQLPTSLNLILGAFASDPDYFSQIADIYPRYFGDHKEWRVHDEMMGKMFAGRATPEEVGTAFDNAMAAEIEAEKAAKKN